MVHKIGSTESIKHYAEAAAKQAPLTLEVLYIVTRTV